jgi:hypothetical protein
MKSFLTILAIFLCCKKLSSQNLQDLWIGDNGYYLKIGTLNSHNLTIEYFNDKECKREDGRYQYFLLGDTLRVEDKISKFLAQKRKIDYKFRFDFLVTNLTNQTLTLIPIDTNLLLNPKFEPVLNYRRRNEVFTDTINFEKLVFRSTGCFGRCPSMRIEIDNKKNLKFIGGQFSHMEGHFTSTLSDSLYKELINILRITELDKLKNNNSKVEDAPIFTIEINYNQKQKLLKSYKFPLVTDELFSYLMSITKKIKLNKNENVQISFIQ